MTSSMLADRKPVSEAARRAIDDFLYEEARLADEHQYSAWEALWADDALYWVPAAGGRETDPARQVSYIYDNRQRLRTRVAKLNSGEQFSQLPQSGLCRLLSNIVVEGQDASREIFVSAKFILIESRREMITWAGQTFYKLRPDDGGLKLVEKQVVLVNHREPLPKIPFLL